MFMGFVLKTRGKDNLRGHRKKFPRWMLDNGKGRRKGVSMGRSKDSKLVS